MEMKRYQFNLNMAPNGLPFHPRIVAVLHFSLIQLHCGTSACQKQFCERFPTCVLRVGAAVLSLWTVKGSLTPH